MLLITPNFLIISSLTVGALNLLTPFVSKKDSAARSKLLMAVSCFFFFNIIIIDWLYLKGVRSSFTLFAVSGYSFALHLEALGLIFLNLLGVLWICSLMYTIKYLSLNNIGKSSKFLFFLNLSVLSGVMVAMSANLITMFMFYEILTLSTIPLIAHDDSDKVRRGLYKYLKILMISSMVLFLPAIVIIYAKVGNCNFIYQGFIADYFNPLEAKLLLLLFIFGISKAALFPLHRWLPAAMVASYPVSALLHAVVVVKAGLFCIYKTLVYVFGLAYLHTIFGEFNWLIYFPIFTIFYSSIKALRMENIKMILAYSTINHLSVALLSAFMFTPKALSAAMFHLLSHSLGKICLFYAMGSIYSLKSVSFISDLTGMGRQMPKTSLIILISILSLIGIPPFGGFISKLYIILAAANEDQFLVMITIVLSGILSAYYMIKILIFLYKPSIVGYIYSGEKAYIEEKLPLAMLISMAICLVGTILFFFIVPFINQFGLYI